MNVNFFWMTKLLSSEIEEALKGVYEDKFKTYKNHWNRSFKKFNSTHIICISINPELTKDLIRKIESDLIETMNPTGNIKRPKPTGELQEHTIEIIKAMKSAIHKNRPKKPYFPESKQENFRYKIG